MANSPDLQMHDLICERDQLLKDVDFRNSMLDRLNASNERLTAENHAAQILLRFWYMDHCGGLNYCECGVCKETRDFLKDVSDGD